MTVIPRTALVTGVTGQDGVYLAQLLGGKGYRVVGLTQPGSRVPNGIEATLRHVEMISVDLRNGQALRDILRASTPDEVYNLAAMSSVAASWGEPALVAEVNGLAVLQLLQVIHELGHNTRFLQASSAEMFGAPEFSPQNEETALRPRNPYAVAKTFAHHSTITYREAYGLHASTVILFNHESPIRDTAFVTRKITRGVAAISLGISQEIVLGNINVERDWGFAGDYVRAMWLALQKEEAGDYVLATGVRHSLHDLLDIAFARVGVKNWLPFVRSDDLFRRPTDTALLIGDATKARRGLGWTQSVSFIEMVQMMVDHDIQELSTDAARRRPS